MKENLIKLAEDLEETSSYTRQICPVHFIEMYLMPIVSTGFNTNSFIKAGFQVFFGTVGIQEITSESVRFFLKT
jgi:hypothetical protein